MKHTYPEDSDICSVCEQPILMDWEMELLGEKEDECKGLEGLVKTLRGRIEVLQETNRGLSTRLQILREEEDERWKASAVEAVAHRRTLTDIRQVIEDIEWDKTPVTTGIQAIKILTANKWDA